MKIIFIGDPNDNNSGAHGKDGKENKTITLHGVTFEKDEETEVSEAVAAKLGGHSHFAVTECEEDEPFDISKASKTDLIAFAKDSSIDVDSSAKVADLRDVIKTALETGDSGEE